MNSRAIFPLSPPCADGPSAGTLAKLLLAGRRGYGVARLAPMAGDYGCRSAIGERSYGRFRNVQSTRPTDRVGE